MASGMVLEVTGREPAPNGLNVTFRVVFVRDDVTPDVDEVTILMGPADTTNTLTSRLATAVRNRATALGYSIPANGLILPAFAKG